VRLTISHRKTLLRNLNRGGQGPIWAVAPLDGWNLKVRAFYKKARTIQEYRSSDAAQCDILQQGLVVM
jgi:hypothetical protein